MLGGVHKIYKLLYIHTLCREGMMIGKVVTGSLFFSHNFQGDISRDWLCSVGFRV